MLCLCMGPRLHKAQSRSGACSTLQSHENEECNEIDLQMPDCLTISGYIPLLGLQAKGALNGSNLPRRSAKTNKLKHPAALEILTEAVAQSSDSPTNFLLD